MRVKDIMDQRFHSLHPDDGIPEAVRAFKAASLAEGKKIFGLMVIDEQDRLQGMLSMFDILLYVRPKHIRVLGEMDDIHSDEIYNSMIARLGKVRVMDLMSTDLQTVRPDTHLLLAMDLMVRRHLRRLPVVDRGRVLGMVYRSDLFHCLMETLARDAEQV